MSFKTVDAINKKPNSLWCEKHQIGLASRIWSYKSVPRAVSEFHMPTRKTTNPMKTDICSNLASSKYREIWWVERNFHKPLISYHDGRMNILLHISGSSCLPKGSYLQWVKTYLYIQEGFELLEYKCPNSMTMATLTLKLVTLVGCTVCLRAKNMGAGQSLLPHVLPSIIFPFKGTPLVPRAANTCQACSHGTVSPCQGEMN